MRAIAIIAACAVIMIACSVDAVPVSKRRFAATLQQKEKAQVAVSPPVLSSNFHAKYAIYLLNVHSSLLPHIANWVEGASKLIDGEAWQMIDPSNGQVTIKTYTKPSVIGGVITSEMTQVWVGTHGWTQKGNVCTPDQKNEQLVISGDILTKTGVFKGTSNVHPLNPHPATRPVKPANADGTYTVDEWFATLPNGEGTVTYYLLSGTTVPIMSHYVLAGKPPVWVQYEFVTAGPQSSALYTPTPVCTAAAAAHGNGGAPASAVASAPAPVPKKK